MKYDVIVVGGDYSGGRLAARLSEDPTRSILLLEAGVPLGPEYGGSSVRWDVAVLLGGTREHPAS